MKRVCGLDVHKDNAFVCILSEKGEKIEFKTGVLTVELDSFRDKLIELGVGEVAMESTAVYWMPIWRILVSDFKLYLVNPLSIKQLPGRKSDVKDAEWIATMDAALQRCNIRISNYVSNVDTKGYLEVVDLLSKGTTDPESLAKKIHGRTINKHGRDTIMAALTGVVTDIDSDLLRQYKEELDLLKRHKHECLSKMREMCEELYSEELKRIEEIPGISAQSATQIIAEIGTDMKMFLTARTLVAWAGLKPRNDGSNGKIKSRRITHGNKYLRKLLIESAWAASRTKDCFFSSFSYRMVTIRKKNRFKVQVAIARKLLVVIWNILAKGVCYSEKLAQTNEAQLESLCTP